ncbi:ribonuclease P protein subunit p29 [Chironomus tepperi]|uniref:ribonuclease P protein subunit p29 n=1 Tax=Chironomus tepperi TaxID=113505 RepID=UPI00391EF57E
MNTKIIEVQNVIENLIHPREKKACNIQELNQHQALSNVKKKIKKPKKLQVQKKRLSRTEMKELGLYSLPKKTMKYDDYKELNSLWNSYMEQQLGTDIQQIQKRIDVTSFNYDQFSGLIHKSDFHGAKVKVLQSKCVSTVGIKGIIILDTKGTFNIICKDNVMRVVPKNVSIFELKWNNLKITLHGKSLAIRSAERSVKKVKTVRLIEL